MGLCKNVCRWAFAVLVLGAVASAQSVLTDDAFTSSVTPKLNYGDSIALVVASGSSTYVKFSLANLPAGLNGSNISGANIVLYVDAVLKPGAMDVYTVNGPWSENQITFNTPPPLGALLQSAVPVSKTGYLSLDVTAAVQEWLNSPLTNNGIALVASAGSPIFVSFDSKENILTSHRGPYRCLFFSIPANTAILTPLVRRAAGSAETEAHYARNQNAARISSP